MDLLRSNLGGNRIQSNGQKLLGALLTLLNDLTGAGRPGALVVAVAAPLHGAREAAEEVYYTGPCERVNMEDSSRKPLFQGPTVTGCPVTGDPCCRAPL